MQNFAAYAYSEAFEVLNIPIMINVRGQTRAHHIIFGVCLDSVLLHYVIVFYVLPVADLEWQVVEVRPLRDESSAWCLSFW